MKGKFNKPSPLKSIKPVFWNFSGIQKEGSNRLVFFPLGVMKVPRPAQGNQMATGYARQAI